MLHSRMVWIVIVIISTQWSCRKKGEQNADLHGYGPIVEAEVDEGDAMSRSAKEEVLIYYANDTHMQGDRTENFKRVLTLLNPTSPKSNPELRKWSSSIWESLNLNDTQRDFLHGMASGIERDSTEFTKAVRSEFEILRDAICKQRSTKAIGLFAISNSGFGGHIPSSKGVPWIACNNLSKTESTGLLDTSKLPQDARYAASPLSSAEALEMALVEATRIFNPAYYNFVFIAKSHGTDNLALVPKVVLDATKPEVDAAKLLVALAGANDPVVMGKEGMGTGPLPPEVGAAKEPPVGTTKEVFLEILGKLGREKQLWFSMVVMESCNSSLELDTTEKKLVTYETEPTDYRIRNAVIRGAPNIEQLVGSDADGLPYSSIKWRNVFAGEGERISSTLRGHIDGHIWDKVKVLSDAANPTYGLIPAKDEVISTLITRVRLGRDTLVRAGQSMTDCVSAHDCVCIHAQTEITKDPHPRINSYRKDSVKRFKITGMNKDKSHFVCSDLAKSATTRSFSIICVTPVGDPSGVKTGGVLLLPETGREEQDLLPHKDPLNLPVAADLCNRIANGD